MASILEVSWPGLIQASAPQHNTAPNILQEEAGQSVRVEETVPPETDQKHTDQQKKYLLSMMEKALPIRGPGFYQE